MLEDVGWFLWVWSLWGHCQVRLRPDHNVRKFIASPHPFNYCYALFLLGLTIAASVDQIIDTICCDDTIILRKGVVMFAVDMAFVAGAACAGIITGLYHRKRFAKILCQLNDIERLLHTQTSRPFTSNVRKIFLALHVLNIISMGSTLAYDWYAWTYVFEEFSWSYQITYLIYFIITSTVLKFVFVAFQVKKQFELINHLAVDNLTYACEPYLAMTPNIDPSYHVKLLQLWEQLAVHDNLYDIVAEANIVFSCQNFFTLLYLMEQLVCCPFYSLTNRQLFNPNKRGIDHFISLYILWTITILVLLLTVLYVCSAVKNEAEKFVKIIAGFMNPLKTTYPYNHINLFLMKLGKRYKGFTVFDILELDLSLALHMVASAMTYLVIFLQF